MELFLGAISTISPLTLLPGNCSLCLQPIQPQNHCLCNLCISELPWLKTQCQRCATPLNHNKLCPDCQQNPPPYRRCIAAFEYQKGAIDKLILDIKTNPHSPEATQLSNLLSDVISLAYQDSAMPTIMIPVPLHWRKLLMRGFNQSTNIASSLSRKFNNTVILDNTCLRRASSSPQHLSPEVKDYGACAMHSGCATISTMSPTQKLIAQTIRSEVNLSLLLMMWLLVALPPDR